MPNPIVGIAARFKNTHDLAGVAEAIRDSAVSEDFVWGEDGFNFGGGGVAAFCGMRTMNCYEFVHFCAYLCGPQTLIGAAGTPLVRSGDRNTCCAARLTIASNIIGSVTSIGRGALVAAVHKSKENNQAGFFHIGIATTGTTIVHLIRKGYFFTDDLHSETLAEAFNPTDYSQLWVSAYNWAGAQSATYVAPMPSFALAGPAAGTAGIGAAGSTTQGGR